MGMDSNLIYRVARLFWLMNNEILVKTYGIYSRFLTSCEVFLSEQTHIFYLISNYHSVVNIR